MSNILLMHTLGISYMTYLACWNISVYSLHKLYIIVVYTWWTSCTFETVGQNPMYKFEFKYWFIKSTILKVFASGCVDPCVCYI